MKEKAADKYIKVQSVAETLSCTDQYVYMLVQQGSLKAIKIGERALRISEQSLQEFIAAGRISPEDYFAPKEPPEQKPEKTRIIRSNWMNR
jgi:excisionase family DNA binding protein